MIFDMSELKTGEALENFAYHYFSLLGYDVVTVPSTGNDGGKDLILEESLLGCQGCKMRWLVSCKNTMQARGGKGRSVGVDDENVHLGRLRQYNCLGFKGFYPYGLSGRLQDYLSQQFDPTCAPFEIITETMVAESVIGKPEFYEMVRVFLPETYQRLVSAYKANVCQKCGRSFLDQAGNPFVPVLDDDYGHYDADNPPYSNGRFVSYTKNFMGQVEAKTICHVCVEELEMNQQLYGDNTVCYDVIEPYIPEPWEN